MKIKVLIFSFIFMTSLNEWKIEVNNENDDEVCFKEFTRTFTNKSLPLNLDRVTTFSYMSKVVSDTVTFNNSKSPYPEIKHRYYQFIPHEFLSNAKTTFRSIFIFPEHNEIISLIIAVDEYRVDGEQNALKLIFITYDKNGNILGYINLAGYELDIMEKFAIIEINETIVTTAYSYVDSLDQITFDGHILANFEEIKSTYKIDNSGAIIKQKEYKRIGHFKENGIYGYIFIQ